MNIGQSKRLIDMGECFRIYYGMGTSRSLQKLLDKLNQDCPEKAPSLTTLKQWSRHENWVEQCMLTDQEVATGVKEKMLPEWIKVKAELFEALIEQVRMGVAAGIGPENTRDLVAASKEIRSMMGEGDSVDVKGSMDVVSIYIPDNKRDND
jgi:uracil DNA glycosylase